MSSHSRLKQEGAAEFIIQLIFIDKVKLGGARTNIARTWDPNANGLQLRISPIIPTTPTMML